MSRLSAATQWHMTGIDISMRQLERNTSLAEKVHGDLQVYRWPSRCFDLIVCWDVIEHLNDPVAAITGLAEALRPGGGLVLAFPNFWSLKGLVTKFTPFRLHAWFYRYILGDRRRIEELDQFPTPFRLAISPARIVALGRRLGLTTVLDEHYEGPVQTHMRARSRLADIAWATRSGPCAGAVRWRDATSATIYRGIQPQPLRHMRMPRLANGLLHRPERTRQDDGASRAPRHAGQPAGRTQALKKSPLINEGA